jgi:SAM-dependent methyltransferase
MNRSVLPVPPDELVYVGQGDFAAVGEIFLKILVEQGGLMPHQRVLEVGCGIGRIAAPLTRYIQAPGSYDGLDIVDVGIDWCRREITSRFPHFRFHHANIFNRGYNPRGKFDAARYRFPFRDEEFDFVFLTSVFTHMLPIELQNYMAEVARVMKRGATCLITYCLRNEDSIRRNAEYQGDFWSWSPMNGYWTTNPRNPEDLTSYDEGFIRVLYDGNGLTLGPIHYGSWCGRTKTLTQQDVVVARKVRSGCLAYPRISLKRHFSHVGRRLLSGPLQKYVWRGCTIESVEKARMAAAKNSKAA